MKSTILISLIAALNFGLASASPSRADAEKICGDLGVMDTSNLPEGTDLSAVRLCANHPLGRKPNQHIQKRDCWYKEPVGCTDGWCWKTCGEGGSGKWCWTAAADGNGDWLKCNAASDCSAAAACGVGNCDACGCDCRDK
ncbi:hypothetical protein AJ79_06622 [Helicocarpus griseus UAMH5409]|uniref:IDI-2 n=1 Tax=Helicocarpus griseus UAMH5409 TaxID=1447875 RepID=A0A2B7XBS1_9EURO|nr:hypothetical protein AJ79_06622 [Helicocarpus griseus UAMH5409]